MIIAIDPGLSGSIIIMARNGNYIDHLLMPVIQVGAGKRVNGAAVHAFIRDWIEDIPAHCFIESVNAMPGQGVSSMFRFGHSAGLVEGVVTGLGIPLTLVTPQTWKKHAGLIGQDKDASRSRAVQLFPGLRVLDQKAKGQAVADALLIGRYGLHSLGESGSLS